MLLAAPSSMSPITVLNPTPRPAVRHDVLPGPKIVSLGRVASRRQERGVVGRSRFLFGFPAPLAVAAAGAVFLVGDGVGVGPSRPVHFAVFARVDLVDVDVWSAVGEDVAETPEARPVGGISWTRVFGPDPGKSGRHVGGCEGWDGGGMEFREVLGWACGSMFYTLRHDSSILHFCI